MYFFWQATPTSPWTCALASERERTIRDKQPALVTVLDVDNGFDRDLTLDEYKAVKYSGPLYFDFDGESIEEVIPQFQTLLNKLRDRGLDLNQVRMFATGGRGFHVEIPMQVFIPKPPASGIAGLPHIYREMAHELFVDLMDMRIYSAKKGRMWRCPAVERDNGKFKVPLTQSEAMGITVEGYDELCSRPRSPMPIDPPTFNPDLGLLYSRAKDKVDASAKKARNKKSRVAELKRFGGQWPATVARLLQGEDLKDGVGWNRVAMQLALTADALGKTEEQLLTDAEPLLETYSGDSDRYGSYRKRKSHLQEMFRYLAGNITYDWSAGGIISLVQRTADVSDLTNGEYVPDEEEESPEAEGQAEDEDDDSVTGVIRVSKSGLFVRDKDGEGWTRACHVGMSSPIRLMDIKTNSVIGYEVEVFVEGKGMGTHELPLKAFSGKARFQDWTMLWSAAVRGNDNDISSLADVLRRKTERSNKVMYTLTREGVDVVLQRGATEVDLVYASAHGVLSSQGNAYRFRSEFDSNHAGYSDLMVAPPMEDNEESRALIDNLMSINTPMNMGLVLGWMSAAFLCQPLRKSARGFPTLQVYGQAGAGKSSLIETVANLHYYLVSPRKMAAAGQTQYPIIAAVTSSASVPVIFEEVKRREMSKHAIDFLMNVLRNNYDGSNLARGGISDVPGKGPVIRNYECVAPLVTLGEGLETQAAILERCVVVSLSKQDRMGRAQAFDHVEANRAKLGCLGRQMVNAVMTLNYGGLAQALARRKSQVREALGPDTEGGKDRPIHNQAVVLLGLDFLGGVLRTIFGDRYVEQIETMQSAILANLSTIIPENKSEASRVLDCLARLTREDDTQFKLEKGKDYTTDGAFVDLKIKNVYPKYVRYVRSLGQEPLYDTQDAFIAGMYNYAGTVDMVCLDNQQLKHTPLDVVFRFEVAKMEKEKIEHFNP